MRAGVAVLAALAIGCGRIGFDEVGENGDAGSGDAALDAPLGPFGAPQLIPVVDSAMAEDDASLTGDLLEIYFVRGATSLVGSIYMATRANPSDMFGTPIVLPISTTGDATARVSRDGLRLWVGSPRAGGVGSVDIWFATRPNRAAMWTTIANVTELNAIGDDIAASEYANQTRMVMTSDRAGSQDLFGAERAALSDPWSMLQPFALNTTQIEQDPWIMESGLELWFSANRADSLGARDIYHATRSSIADEFGSITRVEVINTSNDEGDPWVSPDGRMIVFSSDRGGNFELYQATR